MTLNSEENYVNTSANDASKARACLLLYDKRRPQTFGLSGQPGRVESDGSVRVGPENVTFEPRVGLPGPGRVSSPHSYGKPAIEWPFSDKASFLDPSLRAQSNESVYRLD